MDLKTASIRTVSSSLTVTAAIALIASPAHAEDYVVKPGDTVSGIASSHGLTVGTIVTTNGLDSRATIYAGQKLLLPDAPAPAPVTVTHTVVEGDTLWDLAARYGTTVADIQRANGLSGTSVIRIGATLTVPGAKAAPTTPSAATPSPAPSTYVVASGDTLWSIAKRFGTSVAQVAKDNGISNPSLIRVGQSLVLPAGVTAPSAPATAPVATSVTTTSTTYVVVRGDTLSGIASRFGSTVAAISSANGLTNPSIIRTGQSLTIPGGAPTGLVGDTFLGRTYPKDVVAAANVNKATLNSMDVPTRTQMQQLVIDTANAMGVDPALAQAIAYQESGFNQRAVSPANAIGCMQVIPSSGEWASDLVGRDLNLLVPADNVTAGIAILKQLQRNGTPLETAIAGYYQGERSVRERGLNADTKVYVASVVSLMDRFE